MGCSFKSIVNAFQSISKKSNRKPNKIWVDKGSEFYNSHFKKWLKNNNIEMYSTHNEGKSAIAGRFIRTIKNKIYRYMTSILKNMYIDKLDKFIIMMIIKFNTVAADVFNARLAAQNKFNKKARI